MPRLKLLLLLILPIISINVVGLSAEAEKGKAFIPMCNTCHKQKLNPPLAPPFWGVQRLYKKHSANNSEAINKMVAFVKAPSKDTAIHKEGVKQLGLMAAMPLPDEMLKNIAAYILEENFPPPCEHWKVAISRAKEKGDMGHAKKDKGMYNKFCTNKSQKLPK